MPIPRLIRCIDVRIVYLRKKKQVNIKYTEKRNKVIPVTQ